jgi:sensor c-di-GMP phosphodiesterase-like protein
LIALWSRRGRMVLGVIGLLLVSVPVAGVQVLVAMHTRELAERTVKELAEDYVGRAEAALDSGLAALSDLSNLGVAGCGPRELDLMRRTVYANLWIKEVAVVRSDGQILCNHIGDAKVVDRVSSLYPSSDNEISIQLVELGSSSSRGLMLLWASSPERGLSAIVSGNALTADVLPRFLRHVAAATVTLSDRSVVASLHPVGRETPTAPDRIIEAGVASTRFPIGVRLAAPISAFTSQIGELFTYAQYGSIVLSAMVFGLFVYVLRGPPVELARLREAFRRGEIVPYYQPMVDLRTGRLVGCEVLMRWCKPDGTITGPDEFVRTAEASDLAWPMTLELMRRVRADLESTFGPRPALKISINLFNTHFGRLRTVNDVQEAFGGSDLSYRQLVFELTERQPLGDVGRAQVVIRRLQQLGARVALDDAGTGHSGLAYLHQLGVDVVKIDKLFVDTIVEDQTPTPIIDSLIRLGHALRMEVVAEGVESFRQLDYLREHGADSAQGYLFSPPLPKRAFLELVGAMEPLAAIRKREADRTVSAMVEVA